MQLYILLIGPHLLAAFLKIYSTIDGAHLQIAACRTVTSIYLPLLVPHKLIN